MILENYINDLLFRYDCVIVPNFGGFITNKISATLNKSTHVFNPPTKQIGFNSNLTHNDGLLANYIASVENISFEKANGFIDTAVASWLSSLEKGAIEIVAIGQISSNEENQLVFEPNTDTNFLTDSFGLSAVEVSVKEALKENVIPLYTQEKEEVKKGVSTFVKIAAAAAILLTVGIGYQQYELVQEENKIASKQLNIEKKIQEATFVIGNPLPTINLNVKKEKVKEFHLVAGAFELLENANKRVIQLQSQGYNAVVLGKNKWGLTQVSFDSFETKSEAREVLSKLKEVGFNDAWLLVKKFQ